MPVSLISPDFCEWTLTDEFILIGNLDGDLQDYLELWFPREVKEKEKLNHSEAAQEELLAMGLNHKCVIQ